jgi:cytoskeletal protein CcmA (bactofilin family)
VAEAAAARTRRTPLEHEDGIMSFLRKRKPAAPLPVGDGYSVLDAQLRITGDIETDGTLRIDGRLEGSVRRGGVVILGVGASVKGSIVANEVVVGGTVEGDIHAAQRVELQPTAVVTGDIEAGTILIQEGGALRGRLFVRPAEGTAAGSDVVRPPSLTPHSLRLSAPAASPAT